MKILNDNFYLNCHFQGNFRMWVVIGNFKVFHFKIFNIGYLAFELEFRKRSWLPLDLLLQSINVVQVDVSITKCVHKLVGLQF